jgi:hypothetical protein
MRAVRTSRGSLSDNPGFFSFGRRRGTNGFCRHSYEIAHQVWNVARAVWQDLALDAHDHFRAVMLGKNLCVVVDRRLASDRRANGLAIQAHEQQPDIRISEDIAK